MKGVGSGVERRRGASGLKPARGGGRRETRAGRKSKSLRNGVHHADGVVWGPVRMRTRLLHPLVRVIRGSSPLRFLCLGQLPSRHHGLQVLRPQLPHLRRAELALRVHRVLLRLDRLALLPLALPLFKRVGASWVPPNRTFKMILPNGAEMKMRGKEIPGLPPKLAVDGGYEVPEVSVTVYDQKARSVLITLVPVRPRSRDERRFLRTFSPGARHSPPIPRFRSRHTSTPFNSASDAFELHPDVRSYGQLPKRCS